MTLGEKIKSERRRLGLSQTQLAGDKITRNMLSAIESDKANPSISTLSYLAERLSVSLSYLFSDADDALIQRRYALIGDAKNDFKAARYKECIEKLQVYHYCLLHMVKAVNVTATTNSIYRGDTLRNIISSAVRAASAPVKKLSFAFFAMFIIGTAMSETTTGRIPLKMAITVGLS